MPKPRLLYLGFAFPPGCASLFPGVNPAGHGFETQMIGALRDGFEIRSVGLLPMKLPLRPMGSNPASGVEHDLVLTERKPELFHRYLALAVLRRKWREWRALGWRPDVVLVYNLSPVYNAFIRWLVRAGTGPARVLLLLDSAQLGTPLPWLKRVRYHLKPLIVPDTEMLPAFHGVIGLSETLESMFRERGQPFLWMPGACEQPSHAPERMAPLGTQFSGGKRFGYFGALAAHSGILELLEVFQSSPTRSTLHIAGFGKLSSAIRDRCAQDSRLEFHGWLASTEDCQKFGRTCDVLVNPRPRGHGNENSFPSKVFAYALCGRIVLTTHLGGVEAVLGPGAVCFDESDFAPSLRQSLAKIEALPAEELARRGQAIREHVLADYSWPRQGARIAAFLRQFRDLALTDRRADQTIPPVRGCGS